MLIQTGAIPAPQMATDCVINAKRVDTVPSAHVSASPGLGDPPQGRRFQGCMVIPAGSGGGVENRTEGGPVRSGLVNLIVVPVRPRMPRMREVGRLVEVGPFAAHEWEPRLGRVSAGTVPSAAAQGWVAPLRATNPNQQARAKAAARTASHHEHPTTPNPNALATREHELRGPSAASELLRLTCTWHARCASRTSGEARLIRSACRM